MSRRSDNNSHKAGYWNALTITYNTLRSFTSIWIEIIGYSVITKIVLLSNGMSLCRNITVLDYFKSIDNGYYLWSNKSNANCFCLAKYKALIEMSDKEQFPFQSFILLHQTYILVYCVEIDKSIFLNTYIAVSPSHLYCHSVRNTTS